MFWETRLICQHPGGCIFKLSAPTVAASDCDAEESECSASLNGQSVLWRNAEKMKILITEMEIQERVRALGERISDQYSGRSLTVLGVLTGSIVLLADLIRATSIPLRVALIQASSYGGTRTNPGGLTINSVLVPDLRGRDVVILDDIFDTGSTMVGLYKAVESFQPASIRSAVLLWKPDRTVVKLQPDYFCFEIPDEFVVGYGLDYNDEFRNLPFIGIPSADDLMQAATRSD